MLKKGLSIGSGLQRWMALISHRGGSFGLRKKRRGGERWKGGEKRRKWARKHIGRKGEGAEQRWGGRGSICPGGSLCIDGEEKTSVGGQEGGCGRSERWASLGST